MVGPEREGRRGGDAGAGSAGFGQNRSCRNGHCMARSGRPGCLSLAPRESDLSPDSSYSKKAELARFYEASPPPWTSSLEQQKPVPTC